MYTYEAFLGPNRPGTLVTFKNPNPNLRSAILAQQYGSDGVVVVSSSQMAPEKILDLWNVSHQHHPGWFRFVASVRRVGKQCGVQIGQTVKVITHDGTMSVGVLHSISVQVTNELSDTVVKLGDAGDTEITGVLAITQV